MRGRHRWVIVPAILTAAGCAKGGATTAPSDATQPNVVVDASCGNLCDSDMDGVPDPVDQCPNTPPGQPVNSVGCADSQLTPMLEANFPPYGLTWTPTGDPGRAGGLTWTYTGIDRGDLFHIWWIVCDDPATPCGVSLSNPMVAASEGWHFDSTDSDLPNGKLVETNSTQILLADGTMPMLAGRLTLTIVDGNGAPVAMSDVGTLKVPARAGVYGAEITGTAFTATALIEVEPAGQTTFTPYLDYYDAQQTPMTGGGTAMSFGGSFYDK